MNLPTKKPKCMQEKTTNLTASMQGILYEANFKNRHPCGTLRKSFPSGNTFAEHSASQFQSGNTFAEHSASHSRVETRLRNIPQVNSQMETRLRNTPQVIPEWKHICGTFRKSIPSGNTFAEHSANKSKNENLLNKLFFNYFINEKI